MILSTILEMLDILPVPSMPAYWKSDVTIQVGITSSGLIRNTVPARTDLERIAHLIGECKCYT